MARHDKQPCDSRGLGDGGDAQPVGIYDLAENREEDAIGRLALFAVLAVSFQHTMVRN